MYSYLILVLFYAIVCPINQVQYSKGTYAVDTPQISPEQALQYAPDDSSVKAAKKLAAINHWQSLQQHATADGKTLIWGEIRRCADCGPGAVPCAGC